MSKMQVKIDGEWLKSGQLFIHRDSEPESVTNCGKTTVDIESIKKYFEDMVRKESEMDNVFDGYKCPICNGTIRVETRREDMGGYGLPNPRLVCNHCKIKGGYAGLMLTEEQERERLIYNFEKAVASRKANDLRKPEKILTDIRDYLVAILDEWHNRIDEPNFYEQNIGVYNHIRKELDDLTEYAEKLGVEL